MIGHQSDFTTLFFFFQLIKSPAPQALSKNRTMMETPTKAPIVPNQSGTELRRRNTTQTVPQSATSLVANRQMNPPSTSSSSTALGASFIQEKSNDSSPSKQSRPGPNVSRMIHNTSVVGRCMSYALRISFLIFFASYKICVFSRTRTPIAKTCHASGTRLHGSSCRIFSGRRP